MTPVNDLPFSLRKNLDTFSRPSADGGIQASTSASIGQGFTGSFTGMGYRALKYWNLKNSDIVSARSMTPESFDKAFITQEEWKENYSFGHLKFEDNYKGRMSRSYAQALLNDAIDDELQASRAMRGGHTKAQIAGNLIGGFLSPVDWAIGIATPELMPLKLGLGGTVASRAGTGAARMFSRTVNGAINGTAQGILAQPVVFGLTTYNQSQYTLEDAMRGIAAGPLIGAAAGFAHGAVRHVAGGGELDRHFANAVMESTMGDKDPTLFQKIAGLGSKVKMNDESRRQVTARFQEIFRKGSRSVDDNNDIMFMSGSSPDPEWLAKVHSNNPTGGRVVAGFKHEFRDTRSVIRDMLDNPDSTNKDMVRLASNDDERFLAEAWETLFGQKLKFVHGGFADAMGFSGFVRGSDPSTAYIRSGVLHDKADPSRSMMFLAGHELGHSIRMRDPGLWTDMVDAMMKTSTEDNGALSDAWALVARRNHESGAWAGLTMNGKMEETFANIVGQASVSSHFWRNLHASSPRSATKLSSFITGLRARLNDLLNRNMTPSTKALHEFLGSTIMRADEDGRALSQKVQKDPQARAAAERLYAKHKPEFRAMARRMSAELNTAGSRQAERLAGFIEWHNQTFPQVGELVDDSATPTRPGRYATILKNRRINSNNPGLYLLKAVFAKAKPGTDEYNTYTKWMQDVYSWVSKTEKIDRNDPTVISRALADHPVIAEFKRNADGTWDIGVLRNQEFPRWTELFDSIESDTELRARAYFEEILGDIRDRFDDIINYERTAKGKSPYLDDPGGEFARYMNTLSDEDIDILVHEAPDALFRGFREHLDQKMSHYRLADDQEAYKNLAEVRRLFDDADTAAGDGAPAKANTKELMAAWEKFRKKYPEVRQELSSLDTVRLDNIMPEEGQMPDEFFKELHAEAVREISHEVNELMDGMRAVQRMGDGSGKGLEFTLAKALMGEDEFTARVKKAIDQMAHQRIIDSGRWPQYERAMKLHRVAQSEGPEMISSSGVKSADLPPGYEDLGIDYNSRGVDWDEVFMASSQEDVDATRAARTISLDEANNLAVTRLKQDHAAWSQWAADYAATADTRIGEWAEELGVPGYTLEPQFKAEGGEGAEAPKITNAALHEELVTVQRTFVASTKAIGRLRRGKEVDMEKFYIADAADRYEFHLRQGLDPDQAAKAAVIDTRRAYQAKAIQVLNNATASSTLKAKRAAGIDTLYSYLDGSARRGVRSAGQSVDAAMHARLVQDTAPLQVALHRLGLTEQMRTNNEAFMRQLVLEMKGQDSGNPQVKELAQVLRQIQETQVGRLNSRGANIRLLDGYVFGQVHSASAISADKAGFIASLNRWLDWEVTERMVGANEEDGTFNRAKYLEALAHEMSQPQRLPDENFNPATMGGNLASRVSQRRTLYFKDTHAFDYDMTYGSGNTAGLIMEQVMKRSELSTIMEHFGSDYKKTWQSVMADAQGAGGWLFNKLNRVDTTFKHLVGDMNHPVDVPLADKGRAVRNYMNSVALWMSGISSLTDLGNMTATARWAGVNPKDIHAKFIESIKLHSKDPKARDFLLAQGAGLQSIINGFSEMTTMRGPFYRFASKASDFTFKWNGIEFTTRVFQSAFHDVMTQHLGSMAKADITPEFRNWLKHYNITLDEWRLMAKHAKEIEGLGGIRLAPDMLPDSPAAQKLRTALMDSVDQAILQPSASDKALLTGGFKSGTISGEMFRTVMQYKGYPLAMVRKVNRRFSGAYGSQGFDITNPSFNQGTADKLVWASSMIGLAAVVLSIKDMLRGREPLNPLDSEQWNLRNAGRIVAQAGVGPFSVAEQFLSPYQAAGPALGTIGSLIKADDTYSRLNSVMGAMPGASLAPLRETSKAVLGTIFTETYGSQYQAFLARNRYESGQSSIFQVDNPNPVQ